MKLKKIRTKLLLLVIPIILIVVTLSATSAISVANKYVNSTAEATMKANQLEEMKKIEVAISGATRMVQDLALTVGETFEDASLETYNNIMIDMVESREIVYGMGVCFEPYVYDNDEQFTFTYVNKVDDVASVNKAHDASYNYFSENFYTLPKQSNELTFIKPYLDEELGVFMISVTSPFYDENDKFAGVVLVDIRIAKLQDLVTAFNKENSWFFVIDENGTYIAHENEEIVKEKENALHNENASYARAMKEVISNEIGKTSYRQDGEDYNVYYNTISTWNWNLVYVVPADYLSQQLFGTRALFIFISLMAGILVIGSIYFIIKRNVEKPIKILVDEFEGISNHTYELGIPKDLENLEDEFGLVGKSLGKMKMDLKQYQDDLQEAVKKNSDFAVELEVQNESLIESEKLVREAMMYSNAIIGAIPDIVLLIDHSGTIVDSEGELSKTKDSIVGKHISYVLDNEENTRIAMEKITKAHVTNEVQHIEAEIMVAGVPEYFDMRIAACMEDRVVAIARKVTELHNHMKDIEYLSYHDQLTGLRNRRYSDEILKRFEKDKSYPLSIVVADVNGLKLINDAFGHEKGDLLLNNFATVLKQSGINIDYIARVGGDEFTIYLPHTEKKEANILVSKMKNECKKKLINGIPLTVSFGVGTIHSENEYSTDVMKIAEDEMYQEKIYNAPERRQRTIDLIINELQKISPKEKQHMNQVAVYCDKLTAEIGLPAITQSKIHTAALLHDIGKIGVSGKILNKGSKLDREETEELRRHSEIGYRILKAAGNMNDIAEIVFAQHERIDGKGYPKRLFGDEIPLESRIIAIADAYEAMTGYRDYGKALSKEEAKAEILKNAGTQFDEELAKEFVKIIDII